MDYHQESLAIIAERNQLYKESLFADSWRSQMERQEAKTREFELARSKSSEEQSIYQAKQDEKYRIALDYKYHQIFAAYLAENAGKLTVTGKIRLPNGSSITVELPEEAPLQKVEEFIRYKRHLDPSLADVIPDPFRVVTSGQIPVHIKGDKTWKGVGLTKRESFMVEDCEK